MSTSFRAVMMPLMTAVCSHVSSSSSCGAYTLRITTAPFIACHATTMGVPVLGRRYSKPPVSCASQGYSAIASMSRNLVSVLPHCCICASNAVICDAS